MVVVVYNAVLMREGPEARVILLEVSEVWAAKRVGVKWWIGELVGWDDGLQ